MTIEIKKPDLEARIQQKLESGLFSNIYDLLTKALDALGDNFPSRPPKHLIDVLEMPAFRGSNLQIERQKDPPRATEL